MRTTSIARWPLRLTVPLALFMFVAATTLWGLYFGRLQVARRVEQETVRNLTSTMTLLVSDLERAARLHDKEALQAEISNLGVNRRFSFAALLDEHDIVLSSMHLADVGKPLSEVYPATYRHHPSISDQRFATVRQTLGGLVAPTGDSQTVVATYPIVLGAKVGELRPTRVGMLVALEDYSVSHSDALDTVTRLAFGFLTLLSAFAIGLGVFFHLAVTRRLRRLSSVAERVGAGNMQIRSGIDGNDEISELARSFDQMLVDKAAAENKRAETERQLQAVWNAAVDAIITIDEQGLVQSANQATEKLFGFSLDEVLGNNVNMLMPRSYANEHDHHVANYLQTGQRKVIGIGREVEGRKKDGTQFPIDLSVSEFRLGDRRLFLGIARDIRERKKAEELEASLGRILEESLNEIFIFDAESLKFLQVNRGARNNLGYSMEELRELTPLDLKPEYSPASFAKLIEPVASRKRELLVFETVHQRKDGSRYDVEVHLQRTSYQGRDAFVAVIVDISDRVRAQERLRVQQRAIESAVNGVVITDPNQPDNPIIYISPAMERMTGYSAEEVIGKNCRFLQNDDRHQETLNELRAAINEQRECRVVLRNYRKDGTPFWNELSIAPVRDPQGRLTHFVGIQSDITEKKKAEQELARLNEQLESRVRERTRQLEEAQAALIRKEKLATLGQLAGGVAHEIRNPLGVIKNAVYFLNQTQTNGDEDTKEAIDEITRGLTNSERIISELLDYARAPESEASPFSLADAIDDALQMIRIPSAVQVVRPSDVTICALGDQTQIERLLANLIQNAIRAMPDGGKLTIACDAIDEQVVTQVVDSGVGIAEEDQEKIFEPLFTKRAKGIGLGLALCRRYAQLNGGSLGVHSRLGEGATFKLTLPLAE